MGWALKSFRYQFDEPGTRGSSSLAWHPLGIRDTSTISSSARGLQSLSQTFSPTTSKPSVFLQPLSAKSQNSWLLANSLSSLECKFQCQRPFIPSFLRLRSPEPSTPLSNSGVQGLGFLPQTQRSPLSDEGTQSPASLSTPVVPSSGLMSAASRSCGQSG